MAAKNEDQLLISIEGKISNLEKAMAKAAKVTDDGWSRMTRRSEQARDRIDKQFTGLGSKLEGTFTRIGKTLGGFGLGVSLTGAGIFAGVQKAVGDLAQISADAKRAGIGAEAFQELSYAAGQSRINVDALTDGIKELQLRADEFVITGKGPAAEAFARIGMTPEEIKERLKDPADMLEEIMRRISRLDKAAQIRILDELFGGTAGEQFIRFLDHGAEGIRNLRREARETGNVLSTDILADAEAIDREFQKVASTVGTKLQQAVVLVARGVKGLLSDLENATSVTAQNRGQKVAELVREQAEVERQLAEAKKFAGSTFDFWNTSASVEALEKRLAEIKAESAQLIEDGRAEMEKALADNPPPAPPVVLPEPPKPPAKTGGSAKPVREKIAALKKSYADLEQTVWKYLQAAEIELETTGMASAEAAAYALRQRILNEAKAQGITLTAAEIAQLDALTARYRSVVAATEQSEAAQARLREGQETVRNLSQSTFEGLRSDLQNGISWADALTNALSRLADQLMQISLNAIFQSEGASGFFGGVAKALGFSRGGPVEGPGTGTSDSIPAMLSDGEYVIRADQAKKHRALLEAINSGRVPALAKGGMISARRIPAMPPMRATASVISIAPSITVNASGGTPAQNRDLAERVSAGVEQAIRGIVQSELIEQSRPGNLLARVGAY